MTQDPPTLLPSDTEGYTLIRNEELLGNTFAISVLVQFLSKATNRSKEEINQEIAIICNIELSGMSDKQIQETVNRLIEESKNRDKETLKVTTISLHN